ncbi:MAG: DUF481 domain-containing protein [Phycisphaerales bacterium]
MFRPILVCALAGVAASFPAHAALEDVTSDLTFSAAEVMQDTPAEGEAAPPAPEQPKGFFEGWDFSVEAGLNGSTGNTERVSFRGGLGGERKTDEMETRLGFVYQYAQDDGVATEHRAALDGRNDWLFPESPWRWFAQARFEYDQFQDWNTRLSGFTGPGYELVKNDTTLILLRAGLGGNYRWGGDDEGFTPEALAGIDIEHQISERQKIFFTGEVYPNLEDGGEFRALARGGWEILVDPEMDMTLKLGFEDRYDSNPGPGTKENDLDYFLALVFKF